MPLTTAAYLAPVFCRRCHEHRFDSTCVNYCFFEQTCVFLDKLSDKQHAICALMSTRPIELFIYQRFVRCCQRRGRLAISKTL